MSANHGRGFGLGGLQSLDRRRLTGLVILAVVLVIGFFLLRVGPLWVATLYETLVPVRVRRAVIVGFLQTVRIAFVLGVFVAPLGVVLGHLGVVKARRQGRPWRGRARWMLVGVTTCLGLIALEAGSALYSNWSHRLPDLPEEFESPMALAGQPGSLPNLTPSTKDDEAVVDMVVLGESSGRGEPYNPWLSVGQMAAWQLEKVFPGRKFRVDVQALGGLTVEQAVEKLRFIKHRPEIILLYGGHNEFQGRYGWDRNISYYEDEGPASRSRLVALTSSLSSTCALIEETIEHNRIAYRPPKHVTRELVDHPAFSSEEREHLRLAFKRRLEWVVTYCERIGALPILVIPAGNDADYPPERSYLDPSTTADDRKAFAHLFQRFRALERTDPMASLAGYRRLTQQQPLFAEAHFRLGRMLADRGETAEADRQFILARDLDGMPMRCPSDFQEVFRSVAKKHPSVVLVDGPKVLRRFSPTGLTGNLLLHDAQHPTLRSYIELTQDLLNSLQSRKALDWPEDTPAPTINPGEVAEHYALDQKRWVKVTRHVGTFYERTAYMRYDPAESLERSRGYMEASRRIAAGEAPEEVEVPGLGVWPEGLPGPDGPSTPDPSLEHPHGDGEGQRDGVGDQAPDARARDTTPVPVGGADDQAHHGQAETDQGELQRQGHARRMPLRHQDREADRVRRGHQQAPPDGKVTQQAGSNVGRFRQDIPDPHVRFTAFPV